VPYWGRRQRTARNNAAVAEDSELIERARRGDAAGFEELVKTYQDLAIRTAYVIVGDHDEASDATQDAFVKAFYALDRFRSGSPFRPWLLRIVANEAINRRRASQRRADLRVRATRDARDAGPEAPEEVALDTERRGELLAAVNRLRPDDRLIIHYRYWLELPEAETAEALGVARGTVKSRLSRALGRLRDALRERTPDAAASRDAGIAEPGTEGEGERA
jgi:RNA polymerase sigma-70 factor (ECF subfamily)